MNRTTTLKLSWKKLVSFLTVIQYFPNITLGKGTRGIFSFVFLSKGFKGAFSLQLNIWEGGKIRLKTFGFFNPTLKGRELLEEKYFLIFVNKTYYKIMRLFIPKEYSQQKNWGYSLKIFFLDLGVREYQKVENPCCQAFRAAILNLLVVRYLQVKKYRQILIFYRYTPLRCLSTSGWKPLRNY